jgi:hypothetical protein
MKSRFVWPLLLAMSLIAGVRLHAPALANPKPYESDEERLRFFMEPRQYPFGFVPLNARERALTEVVERQRVMKAASAAATVLGWTPIGPAPVTVDWPHWKASNGRVSVVAVSPGDSNLVLAGGSEGGIWRSVDGGLHFAAVSDSQSDLSVGAIAFAPSNPQIVYAGMGGDYLGTGVLRSNDAGQTWTRVTGSGFALRSTTASMVVDAGNPNRVVMAQWTQLFPAGSIFASAVMLSEDGGANWRTVLNGLSSSVVAMPGSSNTLIASATFITPQGLYRSTDGGRTWGVLYGGPFDSQTFLTGHVAISAASPNIIYWWAHGVVNGVSQRHLFVSIDSGATWTDKGSALPAVDAAYLRVSPANAQTLFLGTTDLYRSTDGGTTWDNMTRGYTPDFTPELSLTHVDQHGFAFASSDGNRIFLGNDGGIYLSDDGATTFTCLSAGIGSLVQFYGIAPSPVDPSLVFGATQDNGVLARLNGGNSWEETITGDYGAIVFDANDPARFMANYTHGTIYRFIDNGVPETEAANDATFGEMETMENKPRIAFLAPMVSDGHGRVYFGTWRLFATTNFGDSWAPTSFADLTKGVDANGNADTLRAIAVAPGDPNVIYTGSGFGNAMRSTDRGATWTNVTTASLPNRSISAIAPAGDGRTAYLAVSGFGSSHVFRSEDFGATWTSAGSPNIGLPDIPVNALYVSPQDASVVYAGTDIGVFRSDTGGRGWSYASNGMPPVVVTSFGRTAGGTLVAGTYGRGAYALAAVTQASRHRPVKH